MPAAPRLRVIQHHAAEGPGRIVAWAADRDIALEVVDAKTFCWASAAAVDASVLLGGPWMLDDPPDWLAVERAAVRDHVAAGTPFFGICLGAQLIAAALDAPVGAFGAAEAGWCRVDFGDGASLDVPQWHAQGFEAPAGAVTLARSADWPCQAFRIGAVAAVQFHPEWDAAAFAALHRAFGADCALPREDTPRDRVRQQRLERWLFAFLDRWRSTW